MKKLLLSLLALLVVFLVLITSCVATAPSGVSHKVWSTQATSDGSGDWDKSFQTTAATPVYRVWVKNTGSYAMQVCVKYGNKDGQILSEYCDIESGEQWSFARDDDGNRPGVRTVVIKPIEAHPFQATVDVRLAPNMPELG